MKQKVVDSAREAFGSVWVGRKNSEWWNNGIKFYSRMEGYCKEGVGANDKIMKGRCKETYKEEKEEVKKVYVSV